MQKPWTTGELAVLREYAPLGLASVARLLERNEASVRGAAYRHRISLRRTGSRRGRVLGQPAGVSLRAELRKVLVSGEVDASLIAERLQVEATAEVCPCCGKRPQRVATSGLCLTCHLEALTDRHLEALADLAARRELLKARQQVHRERLAVLRAERALKTEQQRVRREAARLERVER